MEQIGLQARLADIDKFLSDLDKYNQAVDRASQETDSLVGSMSASSGPVRKLEEQIESLTGKLGLQNRQIAITQGELDALKAGYDESSEQVQKKSQAIDQLTERLALQNRQIGITTQELEELKSKYGEASERVQKKVLALDRLTASAKQTERQLGGLQGELEQLKQGYDDSSARVQKKALSLDRLTASAKQTEQRLGGLRGELNELRQPVSFLEQLFNQNAASVNSFFAGIGGGLAVGAVDIFTDLMQQAGQALVDVGEEAFGATAQYESLFRTLESLSARELVASGAAETMSEALGMAGTEAQALLDWIESLPPAIQGTVTAAYELAQSFNFSDAQSRRLALALADFQAGAGKTAQDAEEVARAIAQINSTGRVQADELLQLSERGVNFTAVLEKMGLAYGDVGKQVVDAGQFIELLVQQLEGDFGGAAERAEGDWQNLLAALDKTKEIDLRILSEETFKALKPLVEGFVDALSSDEFRDSLRDAGESFGQVAEAITKIDPDAGLSEIVTVLADFARGLAIVVNLIDENQAAVDIFVKTLLLLAAPGAVTQLDVFSGHLREVAPASEEATNALARHAEAYDLIKGSSYDAAGGVAALVAATTPLGTFLSDIFSEDDLAALNDYFTEAADAQDAFREKSADITAKLGDAEADRQERVREGLAELAEAEQDYTASVEEAERELYQALTEAATEHQAALADIATERRDLDADYASERLALEQELASQLQEIETNLQSALADIAAERAEADEDLAQGRAEAAEELNAKLEDLAFDHARKMADIERDLDRELADFDREEEQRLEDHLDALGDLQEDYADKREGLEERLDRLKEEFAGKEYDRQQALQRKLDDLRESSAKKQRTLQEKISDVLAKLDPYSERNARRRLRGDDKREVDRLERELREERAALDKAQKELLNDFDEETKANHKKHQQAIDDLNDRLKDEKDAFDEALRDRLDKFERETSERKLAHDRAVSDLELRLSREKEDYERASAEARQRAEQELRDLDDKHREALSKLDTRHASELSKADAQRLALQAKGTEQIADLEASYREATAKLDQRFTAENQKYDEQRATLQAKHSAELQDLRASYDERVRSVGEKLGDIDRRHRETQENLRNQLRETKDDWLAKMEEIRQSFAGPQAAADQLIASLQRTKQELTQFPKGQIDLTVPDYALPGSPSELEKSLARTMALLDQLRTHTGQVKLTGGDGAIGLSEALTTLEEQLERMDHSIRLTLDLDTRRAEQELADLTRAIDYAGGTSSSPWPGGTPTPERDYATVLMEGSRRQYSPTGTFGSSTTIVNNYYAPVNSGNNSNNRGNTHVYGQQATRDYGTADRVALRSTLGRRQ